MLFGKFVIYHWLISLVGQVVANATRGKEKKEKIQSEEAYLDGMPAECSNGSDFVIYPCVGGSYEYLVFNVR